MERDDWDLGAWYDLLTQVCHRGVSFGSCLLRIKKHPVHFLGHLSLIQALLVGLYTHGLERFHLSLFWRAGEIRLLVSVTVALILARLIALRA